ncbi:hypothetical protein, partial [Enterobacter asburiae]|uniref:hypothetical protein n=1 Tax=Enterobacter asburiae TaxID=61645 RepID=UPI003EE7390A
MASSLSGGITWSRSGDFFRFWGYSPRDVVSGYKGNGVGNGTQCIIEFNTDAPQLDFRLVGNNCQYDLYVDDQRISNKPITTDSTGAPYT